MSNLISLLRRVGRSVLDLVYPPICLHCAESLEVDDVNFCVSCLKQLVPINPKERCPYCFSEDFQSSQEKCCDTCRRNPPLLQRMGAVFDYVGPAASLVKQLKYSGQAYLAKGAGAYMAMQFVHLDWPIPDYIVPMPMAMLRRMERGYNQSLLLAEAVGALLNRPVLNIVQRHSGDYSQAGLNYAQRHQLSSERFFIKKKVKLYDKNILLIDDVMTTGTSLRCCAEVLLELYPKQIYGLTFCRAI